MELTQEHQHRISILQLTVDHWSRHYATAHDELRQWQYHDDLKIWIQDFLIHSLFAGDKGVEACITDMEMDSIPGRQGMKFLYCYQVWDGLKANPNEVALDLQEQGWTSQTLGNVLINKYIKTSTLEDKKNYVVLDQNTTLH